MRKMLILFLGLAGCGGLSHAEESGVASWYGGAHIGRKTANGEIFMGCERTAAHRSLPFGALVRVKDRSSGKSVIVRINDRGPYVKGRIIDLSEGAARVLGLRDRGVGAVTLEVLAAR